ncbi:hepatocyte cell adhesion molecule-like [Xyrauchen texanus]|uniref:hepatocyte cell adhesion molecule-like n=1 Tax=Xyrauchen texanus TaxID=154827 RepID=UPI002242287C|nr:hepatocyte cell adhesion molecule-like [Xyrauchen texanus]
MLVFIRVSDVEMKSVIKGDSVTLQTDLTGIQTDDELQWSYFTPEETHIAGVTIGAGDKYTRVFNASDGRFRDRLNVISKTGNLIIRDVTTEHSGLYKVEINRSQTKPKMFRVTVSGVFDFQTDGVKTVSGTEGDSVTLHTGLTEVVGRDVILWTTLGNNIARFNRAAESISTLDGPDGIFKNRLHVTFLTGDLTISDLTTKHSGLYEVKITQGSKVSYKRYKVEVHARLPVPVITSDSSLNSSSSESSSKCVLVCSVVNVTQVTLSWYKGNSLLSSISVSDLNRSLSLHLECVDDSYSCVINNPIRNQTKHLNITEVYQPCSGVSGLFVTVGVLLPLAAAVTAGVIY